ncbi:MAG: hypothetical protein HUN04_18780 [Desulfobacter sp.]|nr:MAG: hypothetical protein HUN04_18780 [Desulfobacter sp.]
MLKKFIVMLGLLFITLPAYGSPVEFNGHWYNLVQQPSSLTWGAASAAAQSKGGYLASITTDEENSFIAGLFNGVNNIDAYWLGGYQINENTWAWDSKEEWSDSFASPYWKQGEPNNGMGGTQDYLHFWPTAGVWDDMENRNTMTGYVIEYESNPVPLPTAVLLLGSGLLGLAGFSRRSA